MCIFKLFKKKKNTPLSDEALLDAFWQLWVKNELPSPYFELLTVISNLGALGHADFLNLLAKDDNLKRARSYSFDLLPEVIRTNFKNASQVYLANESRIGDEDFLEEYDDIFYDNEQEIDKLLLSYAKAFIKE